MAKTECNICGRDGGPSQDCEVCHGTAKVKVLSRTERLERLKTKSTAAKAEAIKIQPPG